MAAPVIGGTISSATSEPKRVRLPQRHGSALTPGKLTRLRGIMAPSSPYRQAVGQYGTNSIAARGPIQIPSSKRRGSAASDGGGYMQAATMGGQTRADKIAASRADGTFDAKRNAYNGANKGSFMDASGNIGPKAEMPTAPIAATTPATSAPTAQPATPAAMGPPKPRGAMFDGKPKAEFFADAARRGVASMPSGVYDQPEAKSSAPSSAKTGFAASAAASAPSKVKPAHLLFSDRASPVKPAAPANQPRAIDAYVSSPGNRSAMTGKTSEQQAAEAAKAKKAAAAQKTFRAPYLPNRARTMGIN